MGKKYLNIFQSFFTLIGTVIGAGIFGVPYVMVYGGLWRTVFWLVLLGVVIVITHLMLAEISANTPGNLTYVGLVDHYEGKTIQIFSRVITIVGFFLGMVIYTMLGSIFLENIFSFLGTANIIYVIVYTIFLVSVLYGGRRRIKFVELPLTMLLLGILLIVGLMGMIYGNNSISSEINVFLPFGVVLFSLTGISVVPGLRAILDHQKKNLWWVIVLASLICMIVTLIFGYGMFSFLGNNVSQDGITGIEKYLGMSGMLILNIAGFVAVFTSHLPISEHFLQILKKDMSLPMWIIWPMTILLPIVGWFVLEGKIISLIGFLGSVIAGLQSLILCKMYLSFRHNKFLHREFIFVNWYWLFVPLIAIVYLVGVFFVL